MPISLPIADETISSDEEAWLRDLTTAHRTASETLSVPTRRLDGAQASDEEAWLRELTTAHRPSAAVTAVSAPTRSTGPLVPSVASTCPAESSTGPEVASAVPGIASTGPAVASTGSAVASTGPAVASTGLAVASTGPALASTGPAVASTGPAVALTGRSRALRRRAVIEPGPRRQTWDEFVLFAQALGPLPPVAPLPDRHTVLWQLAPVDVELSAFAYGCRRLAAWYLALGPIIFKVGIAADPDHRFWNREYGYDSEREWHFMEVQGRGPANQMRNLEISLIAGLGGLPGCRNEAAGGEGVHPDRVHTCFQYMVVAPCGAGIGQQRAWAMLRDAASPKQNTEVFRTCYL